MNRVFYATSPYSFGMAVDRAWLFAALQDLGDKKKEGDARYEDLLGNWGGETVIGYDLTKGLFEPASPDSEYELYLVNDSVEDPLKGFAIDLGDYLVYHERTAKQSIKELFSPDKIKSSHHKKNPDESDYNLAYSILSDAGGDKIKRIINASFPSREQKKKTVSLFLARLHHETLPALPTELSSLTIRYQDFSSLTAAEKLAFVDECLKIMDEQ